MVAAAVSIPVVACGGPGKIEHISEVIQSAGASAVAIASMLHYEHVAQHKKNDNNYQNEGNTEFLKNIRKFGNISNTNINSIKKYLTQQGIPCRYRNE
jgi:cyclase